MAIGITDILYLQHHNFKLEKIASVVDLGVQEITCSLGHEVIQDFLQKTNPGKTIPLDWVIKTFTNGWAKDFWTGCNKKYVALDVAGEGEYTFFDLNFDSVPESLLGSGDLVCNAGTTEHLINQYNAFKVMHDLTAKGGYMYHALPMAGFHDHGLFNYNVKFFQQLAHYNDYKVIDAFVSLGHPFQGLDKDSAGTLNQDKIFLTPDNKGLANFQRQFTGIVAGLRVVLQKKHNQPFQAASDLLGARTKHLKIDSSGRFTKK